MNKVKFKLFTAGLVLAMALTFSCSSDDGGGGGGGGDTQGGVSSSSDDSGGNLQSYSYCLLSEERICLDGPFTAKDCNTAGGHPSNSCPYGGVEPSSSSGVAPSSNSEGVSSSVDTDDNPSSSGIAPSSGSVEPSSSSGVSSSVGTGDNPSSSSVVPSSSSEAVTPSSSSETVTPSSGSQTWQTVILGYCDYGPFTEYGGGCFASFTDEDLSSCEEWGQDVPSCPVKQARGSMTDSRDGKEYKTVQIGELVWFAENLNYETGNSDCLNNQVSICSIYGRLYDWETAMTACPSGWHLPSDENWQTLVDASGGDQYAGRTLKAISRWGTKTFDNYKFSALPGGSNWWSAMEYNAYYAYERSMGYEDDGVDRYYDDKSRLISVRCVQD